MFVETFLPLLVRENRIRPKGFYVLCSHCSRGNDEQLKELVSLHEQEMIIENVKADFLGKNLVYFKLYSVVCMCLYEVFYFLT